VKKVFTLAACILGITYLLLGQSAIAQSDPDMRGRIEQRTDTRSNSDDRRSIGNDRNKSGDSSKSDSSTKGAGKSGIAICAGEFALCASSTCKPTGKTITVKEDGGKTTKQYPEAICKCPVINANIANQNNSPLVGVAGLNEGNMDGSCRSPGTGKIWSYFSTTVTTYPQEQSDGSFSQPLASKSQNCSAKGPSQGSNCWSYICTVDPKETNGVKTASCRCPYGEGLFGQQAKKDRGFITYAGSTWSNPTAACKELPVGYPDQLMQ